MNDVLRSAIDARAEKLLADYRGEHPFFFATPEHTLMAQGCHAVVPQADSLAGVSRQVDLALQRARAGGHPNPMVVGAIPFDARQPACLSIPHQVQYAGPLTHRADAPPALASSFGVTPQPAPQAYADAVAAAVEKIRQNALSKVVLARTLELASDEPIDVQYILERLARRNAFGYTFGVNLDCLGQGQLIGASPELLLSRKGLNIRSNPLAGSAARAKDQQEDARRSQALLRSAKDLHEHQVVAQAVASGLRPFCSALDVPAGPSLITTGTMWHLSSDIRGTLDSPEPSALLLASSLHPTPAVCGYPADKALALIGQLESFERGFYAGMVGWCDSQGNGEWVLTLRCAQVQGHGMRLFAGAGVVADSEPESELAETSAKFRTLLDALGMAPEGAH